MHRLSSFFKQHYKVLTKISLSFSGLILILFVLSCIPKSIDLTYPGIQYSKSNNKYIKKVTIKVKGKLYKHWFSDSKFIGLIILDNYEITRNKPLIPIVFQKNMDGIGILAYDTTTYKRIYSQASSSASSLIVDKPSAEILGNIIITGDFKTIAIAAYMPDDSNKNITEMQYISAPAKSRDEAIEIKIKL